MKRLIIITAALGLLLALFVPLTSAQPAAQDPAKEEADAYKAWYDAFTAKDIAKEYELGKAFAEKFPSSKNAAYVKKDIARARGIMFNQAMQAKNTGEMIRLGKEALAEDPESLDYLYLLAVAISSNELFASPANFAHEADFADFSQRAIKLIESGKAPAVVDKAKWSDKAALAYLTESLAIIEEHNKNTEKALDYYVKASTLEPTNPRYFFNCGRLHQAKYLTAAQKYQAFPEADQAAASENKPDAKPEVKAALDETNKQADAVINCWARYMALTTGKTEYATARGQVEKALTPLYNYRHPDTPDGLQKLIEQYRTGTAPAPGNPASTKP
jgi:hypothetical protein